MSNAPHITVGSIFTGVGGFDLALESVGMSVEWQIEDDRFCREVLRKRWPETPLHGDARDVRPDDLADVDLMCGGFPCQDLSVAGARAGLDGERSGLWHEYLRLADSLAPRWICIENVPGLLSSNDGRDFAVLLCGLTGFHPEVPDGGWESGGYCEGPKRRAFWRVLDTQYFGPPQRRRRIFVVADARGECGPDLLFEPACLPGHSPTGGGSGQDAAGGARSSVAEARREAKALAFSHTQDPDTTEERAGALSHTGAACFNLRGRDGGAMPEEADKASVRASQGGSSRSYVYPTLRRNHRNNSNPATESKMLVGSLTSSQGGADENDAEQNRLVGAIPRRLTPRECERLQGFPDDWTAKGIDDEGEPTDISDTQRYKQMGNAVSVPVAAWIGQRILEQEASG